MRKIKITGVAYETDGQSTEGLPKELFLDVPLTATDDEIEHLASEYISETTGFLHDGFCWQNAD